MPGNQQPMGSYRKQHRNRIKRTTDMELDSEDSSDEEFLTKSIAHMQIKMVKRSYSLAKTIPLMVNDIQIRAEPDKGADANVMDEYQYRALQHRSEGAIELQKSRTRLRTLQNELQV